MTRGTFANIRLKNQMAPGTEGGWTTYLPEDDVTTIYEASLKYAETDTPTIVLAGIDYGMGSSRDWAAKGTYLLGIKAAIAKSFERIHRSNLIGMGVLPLQFKDGEGAEELGLTGNEHFTIHVDDDVKPKQMITVDVTKEDGSTMQFEVMCRLDSPVEIDYYRNGGILHTVLRSIAQSETKTQA
jgi:aconitate hydratase